MPTDFRREVFKLCKKLQKDETAQKIGTIIHDMSVVSDSTRIGEKVTTSKNDFAYVAKHNNTEFHGFLFLDENIGKIELPKIFSPEKLQPEERDLFERGHKTLIRFVELCLSDIKVESGLVAESLSPYFMYKDVNISESALPLISDSDLQPAVSAFKNGEIYTALMRAKFTTMFERIDIQNLRTLYGTLEKEVNKSIGEEVGKELYDFSRKLESGLSNVADIMFAFSILMISLREALKLSCRMLYRAICGVDLFVLNNDNIINIEKKCSTIACEFCKVFSQDIHYDYSGSEMGSVLLIDCDLPSGIHIHEFGMLIAQTIHFDGEFGSSAKYSFVTVDEQMIHMHPLAKSILQVGLPICTKKIQP